jgi:hypothetical protein
MLHCIKLSGRYACLNVWLLAASLEEDQYTVNKSEYMMQKTWPFPVPAASNRPWNMSVHAYNAAGDDVLCVRQIAACERSARSGSARHLHQRGYAAGCYMRICVHLRNSVFTGSVGRRVQITPGPDALNALCMI